MRTKGSIRVAIAALIAITLVAVSVSAGSTVTRRYYGAIPEPSKGGGPYTFLNGDGVGGAHFFIPSGSTAMSVGVADDSGDTVRSDTFFVVDQYGPLVPGPRFCGSRSGIPIPPGAQGLEVRVLVKGSFACPSGGMPTTGSITVSFG